MEVEEEVPLLPFILTNGLRGNRKRPAALVTMEPLSVTSPDMIPFITPGSDRPNLMVALNHHRGVHRLRQSIVSDDLIFVN